MNAYENRKTFIQRLLREHIEERYSEPTGMSEKAMKQELLDMRDDLVRAWPMLTTDAQMQTHGEDLMAEVRRRHTSRSWPTIKLMLESLAALKPKFAKSLSAQGSSGASRPDRKQEIEDKHDKWVCMWARGEKAVSQGLLTQERITRLKASGRIAPDVSIDRLYTAGGEPI